MKIDWVKQAIDQDGHAIWIGHFEAKGAPDKISGQVSLYWGGQEYMMFGTYDCGLKLHTREFEIGIADIQDRDLFRLAVEHCISRVVDETREIQRGNVCDGSHDCGCEMHRNQTVKLNQVIGAIKDDKELTVKIKN